MEALSESLQTNLALRPAGCTAMTLPVNSRSIFPATAEVEARGKTRGEESKCEEDAAEGKDSGCAKEREDAGKEEKEKGKEDAAEAEDTGDEARKDAAEEGKHTQTAGI